MIENQSAILFPELEKIGYKFDNNVLVFSAKSLNKDLAISFPFGVLHYSLPIDDHSILVVDESHPESVILYDYLRGSVISSLSLPGPITRFESSGNFACLIHSTGLSIISARPHVLLLSIPLSSAPPAISIVSPISDTNHVFLAYSDEATPGNLLIQKIPSSVSPISFPAHKKPVVSCSISNDAKYLVTASSTGTIVRLWTITGKKLHESRRGFFSAQIQHLSFSPDSQFFCATSNHFTAHIFRTEKKPTDDDSYFLTKAEVKVPLETSKTLSAFVLAGGQHLCLITDKGACYTYSVNVNTGESSQKSQIMLPNIARMLIKSNV